MVQLLPSFLSCSAGGTGVGVGGSAAVKDAAADLDAVAPAAAAAAYAAFSSYIPPSTAVVIPIYPLST